MNLAHSVIIGAPVEHVFDCWAALERSPEHQEPTIERTRLTDEPVSVGTRYLAIDQWPGRRVEFEMEIASYDRPFQMSARWDEPVNGIWTAKFASDGDQTVMEFETKIEPTGLLGLIAPLMKPWARRQLANGLASFGNWVESGGC